ncbi:MAG TPA: lysylphosphatidylglycerol synthase transmembrane domain-containing protein [Gaiellaceae bacterium]|nr:lysylphosphatidylglycerol synthase transmembrane domain-containing protein [Gaiellaceae bacterium]
MEPWTIQSARRGVKLFAAPADQPRARRGTDVVLLAAALLGLGAAVVAYPPSAFERALQRFLSSIPSLFDPVWGFLSDLPWFWAILLVLVALAYRRLFVVGQALAALVLGALVGLVASRLAIGDWPHLSDAVFGTGQAPRFPSVRLGEATAVMLTVAPHFVRPVRALDRWILVLGVLGTAAAGSATPVGTLAAVLAGIVAAAAVRLAGGTSIGRPELADVAAALAELGVSATGLAVAEEQVAGVFHVRGADEHGAPLLVKVYGRDAYDTQFIARLWRSLWYRGATTRLGLSRLGAAEHEAFVTLLAASGGVATLEVVTAGATEDDDALLVLRGDAQPLGAGGDQVRGAWDALALLEAHRIGHGRIDPTTVVQVGGRVGLVDFADAVIAPGADGVAAARAQLLMTTAILVGPDAARSGAVDALGADEVAALLPYLQWAALGARLRRELKDAGVDVDLFRDETARALGIDAPEPVRLRRISWRAAIQIALLALATYAILSAAGGVDWGEFSSAVRSASPQWIVAGFVVAQLPRLTQALTTLGAVPAELPFAPVYTMQLATGYMNVALPSNLARMAVNIRFFQRQGLPAATAVAAGTIDSFAGTVVQAGLLVVLLLFSESSLAIDVPFPSGGMRTLLWIVVALVVLAVLAVVAVGRVRRAIVDNVRRFWPDVRAALGALRSMKKLALLVFGSIGTEVLFAIALGLFARAFGVHISIAELLVINISVSLLGTLVPVPGNIGVAEFGLAIGLVSAGMSDETALAAVLLYRISTFYLPPLWGFFALHWLQRNRYL